ncbi:CIS tube protein [Spirosoma areae]
MQNQLNKLRIISLKEPQSQSGGGMSLGQAAASAAETLLGRVFEVQINPEQIARSLKIKNHDPGEPGREGSELQFEKTEPETLEIKFMLDGTGTVPPTGTLTTSLTSLLPDAAYVPARIKELQAVVYNFLDETHRPPFIIVNWGTLVFHGVMEELSYTYNLFHPSGVPLRAEVTLKVKEHKPSASAAAALSLLSPDLTRRRQLRQSDTLLTVCQEVYESPVYYLEIAKANNLTNFRRKPLSGSITAGTALSDLLLPPIDKRTKP